MRDLQQNRFNNHLSEIAKLIQLKIRMERPDLFSDFSLDYQDTVFPLIRPVVHLGYYRKLKAMYRRFNKSSRHNHATFEYFCRQRILWLRRRGRRRLMEILTDRELRRRGLPPYYEKGDTT